MSGLPKARPQGRPVLSKPSNQAPKIVVPAILAKARESPHGMCVIQGTLYINMARMPKGIEDATKKKLFENGGKQVPSRSRESSGGYYGNDRMLESL